MSPIDNSFKAIFLVINILLNFIKKQKKKNYNDTKKEIIIKLFLSCVS
jgi:hypothetical protein